MSPKKSRMPQVSVKLPPEHLVAIDVFLEAEKPNNPEIHRSSFLRGLISEKVNSEEFQQVVKRFREEHPEVYSEIVKTYAGV